MIDVVTSGHRLRTGILAAAAQRTDGISVREIAEQLDEPERRVRHHLDVMVRSGVLGVARQAQRRGALVRYYRPERTPIVWSSQSELSKGQLERLGIEVLRFLLDDAVEAVRGGTLARGDSHVYVRIRRTLDRQGCHELKEIYERAVAEALEVTEESAERAAAADVEGIEVVSAVLLFEAPGPDDEPPG